MTPAALYSGARMAAKLARFCERERLDFDEAWRVLMIEEAKRHRERATHYLRSRTMLKDEPDMFERAA